MCRVTLTLVAGLVAGVLVADSESVRSFEESVEIPAGQNLEVGLKVGEMEVETAAIDEVRVEVTASCRPKSLDKCQERLERLRVESTTDADGTFVKVAGASKRYSKMEVKARFIVPEDSPLMVRMWAGELRVDGGGQDLSVRLKFGDVTVHQPLSRTHSVLVDANLGDASIFTTEGEADPSRPLLVGSKVSWNDGEGDAKVAVNLSAGDITVHLE
jgi:hypothetical protein